MDYSEFKQLVSKHAWEAGLEDFELYFLESNSLSIEVYKQEINKFSSTTNGGVGFRCILNGKMGYASTELFTVEEAKELVERAMENAESIEAEDEVLIHSSGDTYQKISKEPVQIPSSDIAINKALACQKAAYEADDRIVDGTLSYVAVDYSKISIFNSKGLDLHYETSMPLALVEAIAEKGEEKFTSYSFVMKEIDEIDAKSLAEEAVEDTVADIGAEGISSGKYKVVFSGKTMAQLLRTFFSVFSAEKVQQGASLLKGKEKEQIASKLVTIIDDPFYQSSFLQVPFDAEGVATSKKEVIEEGKLTTFLHNLKTAKKAGVRTTANASKHGYSGAIDIMPYNFYIKPIEGEKEDLFRKVGEGVYITNLEGLHAGANPVTGDFSLASSGFVIKDGIKTHAVKGFTVSGNFFEVLKKIDMIGTDLKFLFPAGVASLFGSPSVVVSEMSIAGN